MPIAIGKSVEADFTDPLGLLSNCHLRIRRFLRVLIDVAQGAKDEALNKEQRAALEVALRYFREAAPKHTLDEEESLFPRLRAAQSSEAQAALAQLDALHEDHETADTWHAEVESLGRSWLATGVLSGEDAGRLTETLGRLQALYDRHIAIEDDRIFPLAGRVLNPSEVAAVGREMACRRGVDFVAIKSTLDPASKEDRG